MSGLDHPTDPSDFPETRPPSQALRTSAGLRLSMAWVISATLILPVLIPYAYHFATTPDGLHPTGFIQADMPIYMAKAREYVDDGLHATYANPCASDYGGPRIYFQPWSLGLGLVLAATGWDVGSIFLGFWLVSILACAFVTLRLYEERAELRDWPDWLGLVVFFWGGGLLVIVGSALGLSETGHFSYKSALQLDPTEGWWFLSYGRNLVYPTEAFYHFLFFSTILSTLRRRLLLASAGAALMAASHPFTGVELAFVLWTWLLLEVVFLKDRAHLGRYFVAINLILAGVLGYYLVFLNRYPEHRIVADQISHDWRLEASAFLPAYAMVGALAFWGLRNLKVARETLSDPRNRLFLVWALVAFGLAKHELFIKPRQPIHFTRGYIWTPLFLLGLPTLLSLLRALGDFRPRLLGGTAIVLLVVVFLSDDIVWFSRFPVDYATLGTVPGVRISNDQREVLAFLAAPRWRRYILLSEDKTVGYLATAYTPLRSWLSHWSETPELQRRSDELRAFFRDGTFRDEWRDRHVLFLTNRPHGQAEGPTAELPRDERLGRELVFQNRSFRIYSVRR